jgi:hypothetical protein
LKGDGLGERVVIALPSRWLEGEVVLATLAWCSRSDHVVRVVLYSATYTRDSSPVVCSIGITRESPVRYLLDRDRPDLEQRERHKVPVDVKIVQRSFRTCRDTGISFRRAFVSLVLPLEERRRRRRKRERKIP